MDGSPNGPGMSGLIWQADCVVYFIGGPGLGLEDALVLAGKMK
ncbi:MAG: hypothetical protein AB1523_03425 [Bacillota bacterium]